MVAIVAVDSYAVHVNATTAALTFLIAVLVGSAAWGVRYAVMLSVIATLAFDYFFLAPVGPFAIADPQHWLALIAFLIAGVTTSRLSERARREARNAERRRAEAAVSQQRFADLVNSVEGIVWEADAETFVFSFVSEQAERVLGYPAARWLSESTFWEDHLHPEDHDQAVQSRQTAAAEKRSHDFAYRMIAADGGVVGLRDFMTVVMEGERATQLRGIIVVTKRPGALEQANLSTSCRHIFVRDLDNVIRMPESRRRRIMRVDSSGSDRQSDHELLRRSVRCRSRRSRRKCRRRPLGNDRALKKMEPR